MATNAQLNLWDQPADICRRKHGGDAESRAAFESRDRDGDRAAVIEFLRHRGEHGATSDEFAAFAGRSLNQISGRFSELKASGVIEPSGEKRPTRTGNASKVYRMKS